MLKHLLDGEGEWGRAFSELDTEKFSAPTVTDAEYPKLGFSVAWNDPARGVLLLESFAATSRARGDATRFRVRNLPDAHSVQVRRDDQIHKSWRATDSNSIEIETSVGDYRFEIVTGYRGARAARPGKPGSNETDRAATGSIVQPRTTMTDIVLATSTVAAACPCCAGAG